MQAYQRLLKYVSFRTPSDENSTSVPSSACQFELAQYLENEMRELRNQMFTLMSQICIDLSCSARKAYTEKGKRIIKPKREE